MNRFLALLFSAALVLSVLTMQAQAEMDKMAGMAQEMKMQHHDMIQGMMGMMKDMMAMMKEISHVPTAEQKKRLDEMMKNMDDMMKKHQEMATQKKDCAK